MERNDNVKHYRLRPRGPDIRLTVYDPAADPLEELTLLEGLEFTNVADALRFVHVHYPNAQEIE